MTKTVISVRGVSKRYRLGVREPQSATFAGALANLVRAPLRNFRRLQAMGRFVNEDDSVFWALKDVSFDVREGEVLGVIGRNGAGKSTLLKILSQITEPSMGEIELSGRVGSLLEVGTGFHPELTGRENIYMNGTILGMTKREIDSKLDEIIEFSGVEKFVDTPVKFYSSGMKVRLGFSVAAHLEPEILVIDEVLAVGDYEFQERCLGKMHDVATQGRTVLFVSHNMSAVQSLCGSGIVLRQGSVAFAGNINESIGSYLGSSIGKELDREWKKDKLEPSKPLEIVSARIELRGSQPNLLLDIACCLRSNEKHRKAFLAFDVSAVDGTPIFQAIPDDRPFIENSDEQLIASQIELPALIPGHYKISIWTGAHYAETFDWQKDVLRFSVENSPQPSRTHPHSRSNGFLVPKSRIIMV
ncbi:MAG: polysaccharide ABC transporter ATP-binding protein [Cyclobacteriaceae bacterium]